MCRCDDNNTMGNLIGPDVPGWVSPSIGGYGGSYFGYNSYFDNVDPSNYYGGGGDPYLYVPMSYPDTPVAHARTTATTQPPVTVATSAALQGSSVPTNKQAPPLVDETGLLKIDDQTLVILAVAAGLAVVAVMK